MIFVGLKSGKREVFRSDVMPTEASHGGRFDRVIGPFRTVRGAKAMVHFAKGNNPHIQCVADAERVGKKYTAELTSMGTTS